jgi:hypothetical protein
MSGESFSVRLPGLQHLAVFPVIGLHDLLTDFEIADQAVLPEDSVIQCQFQFDHGFLLSIIRRNSQVGGKGDQQNCECFVLKSTVGSDLFPIRSVRMDYDYIKLPSLIFSLIVFRKIQRQEYHCVISWNGIGPIYRETTEKPKVTCLLKRVLAYAVRMVGHIAECCWSSCEYGLTMIAPLIMRD